MRDSERRFLVLLCLVLLPGPCSATLAALEAIMNNPEHALSDVGEMKVLHVHLSFGDSDDAMRVGYSTNKSTWPANWSSACLYGEDMGLENGTKIAINSFVRSYDPSAWKEGSQLEWDLRFVQLEGLVTGQRYYYRCGVIEPSGLPHLGRIFEFDFRTTSKDWSFIAFGDLGVESGDGNEGTVAVAYTRRRIEDEVLNQSARLVLHYGDISYARGTDSVWNDFFGAVESVASRVPWMTCPGNHEIQAPDSGNELGVPYFARFWMPQQCSGSPYWYSFDYGAVHFVSLSTEHEFGAGSAQLSFLEEDLKRSEGKYAFTITMAHRPLLSSHQDFGRNHSDVSRQQWAVWQPVFAKYGVDLTLWGHVHAYERAVDRSGIPHITSGMAGQSYCCGWWDYSPGLWSLHREDSHGYLRIKVRHSQRPSTLRMEYVRSDDGQVYDHLELQSRHGAASSSGTQASHLQSPRGRQLRQQETPGFARNGMQQSFCMEEEGGEHIAVAPLVPPGLCPTKNDGHKGHVAF